MIRLYERLHLAGMSESDENAVDVSPQDNDLDHLEVYRRRCDEAVVQYTKCLNKLQQYSVRISKSWFQIPLQCAQDLVSLSREIQDGLSAESPDFEKLVELGKTLVLIKRKLFNPAANMAYQIIHLRKDDPGFNKKNLMETALQWRKLCKVGITPPYGSALERDFVKLPWDGSFWNVFFYETIDIFENENDFMEVGNMDTEGHLLISADFDRSQGSRCSSPVSFYSRFNVRIMEEEDNYTEFFEAQFKEFNETWEKLKEVGSLEDV